MKKIIEDVYSPEYILYVQGDGATVVPEMMNNFAFDHVFYTGSTVVGKLIYKMAAFNSLITKPVSVTQVSSGLFFRSVYRAS